MRKLKKPLCILLAVMMVMGLFSAVPFVADAATSDDGVWDIDASGFVTCNLYDATELTIPETIGGITVTSIGTWSIYDFPSLKKVTVQAYIDTLDSASFAYCGNLEELVFEKGVSTIEDGAIMGVSSNGFKLTIRGSVNTSIDNNAIYGYTNGKVTISYADTNTGADAFATAKGFTKDIIVNAHTHTWTIDTMSCTAEDKDTVTANLVCADDASHTAEVTINKDDDEFTVVSTTDATCTGTGTMVIDTDFIYDGQSITEENKNVTIAAYTEHDYSEQKWIWWDNSLIDAEDPEDTDTSKPSYPPLTIYCSHCAEGTSHHSCSLTNTSPKYLSVDTSGEFARGTLSANGRSWLESGFVAPYGHFYSENNYAYYTDTAPTWEWADDYSYATATFDDAYVETDSSIYSEQIVDTLDGNKQKIRYVATINYRGNVYHSARKVDAPPSTHTITWKNDDNSVIDTTVVEDGVVPTHANPTKASTAEYDYTFAGWSPTVVAATADATYTATYTQTKRSYTITWTDDEDNVIDTTSVKYGETPTHADATKASSGCTAYTFSGWTPNIEAVTGEATYKATFTSSDAHTYGNPVWNWTENEQSYTASLKLTCSGCDDEVVLSGDDISYGYNPFCTLYDGTKTTYTAFATYEGQDYENTKTVSSIDTSNVIGNIALDAIMTTAADAETQDGNQFGLSGDVYYRNLTVLGVQKKEAISTTDGQSTGTDLRFIAVAKSELLENAEDYGFMVSTSAQGVWNTDKAIGNLTAEAFPNSKYSCKDTDNTICGDYGKRDTATDYKYVTLAVNGVDENTTIAARFYIKDSNGNYHYAKYTNQYSKTYQGIAVKYSDLD